jgi:diphthamide synthase (EF-2-diphthine--ammonia ligase)
MTSEYALESCGREYNASFLTDLPPGVDACGEKGEFHSFAFDGRDNFVFKDLLSP